MPALNLFSLDERKVSQDGHGGKEETFETRGTSLPSGSALGKKTLTCVQSCQRPRSGGGKEFATGQSESRASARGQGKGHCSAPEGVSAEVGPTQGGRSKSQVSTA
jgi:hypothetical protein